jgi:hypothetical protein
MVRKQAENGEWYHEPPYTWEELPGHERRSRYCRASFGACEN